MSREIEIFKNEEFGEVRVLQINSESWFVAKDISDALGYKDTYDMTRRLDSDERQTLKKGDRNYDGVIFGKNITNLIVVNESGLYSSILGSKKREAKKFKKWVTSEVLPSIRKHGAYMTEDTLEQAIANPDFAIGLLTQLKEYQLQVKQQKQLLEIQQPKVDLYDDFINSKGLYSIDAVSKILAIKGLGRNNFYRYLREKKIIMTDIYRDWEGNIQYGAKHYQAYALHTNEFGYFKHRIRKVNRLEYSFNQNIAYFTSKGVDYIYNRLKREGYVITKSLKEIADELRVHTADSYDIAQ